MKNTYVFMYIISICLAAGCEHDYEIDKKLAADYKPQVVLNSVISPDSPVSVKMFWSKRYDDRSEYQPVAEFEIRLFEGGILVETAQNCNAGVQFNHIPSEGKSYRIEADIRGYGSVKAETSIPLRATAKVSFSKWKNYHAHFGVTDLEVPESKRAIWIRHDIRKGDKYKEYHPDLYSLNPFPDPINSVLESDFITDTESNIAYEYFIRIPRMNLPVCMPLMFSVECHPWSPPYQPPIDWDEDGNPIYPGDGEEAEGDDEILISLITPSDEYDKYYRLSYKQELFNYDADFPIFSETVQVFSNIENGLGIFAGYSSYTMIFDFEGNPK